MTITRLVTAIYLVELHLSELGSVRCKKYRKMASSLIPDESQVASDKFRKILDEIKFIWLNPGPALPPYH